MTERIGWPCLAALALLAGLTAAPAASGANPPKGDRAFGEYLSATCTTCHQITGRSTGGIPPIVAWPDDQFIAVMNAYKNKERDNQAMQTIAGALSEEEIAALAAFFGSLPNQPKIQ